MGEPSAPRLALRPGWIAFAQDEGTVVLKSDLRELRIHIAGAAAEVADYLNGQQRNQESEVPPLRTLMLLSEAALEPAVFAPGANHPSPSRLDRYFEHIGIDPVAARRRVGSSCVLVLGVGGTGSIIIEHLVACGVRQYVLVDRDVVEPANLERQFIFGPGDIGMPKVEAAARYIAIRSPASNVTAFRQSIASGSDLLDLLSGSIPIDVCAICIDEPDAIADDVRTTLSSRGIASLHGGLLSQSGFFGPLHSTNDDGREAPAGGRRGGGLVGFPPYNSIVGAWMASAILHHLAGAIEQVNYDTTVVIDFAREQLHHLPERELDGEH